MFTHGKKLTAAKAANAQAPSVSGKQALVFGGTSGIGKALAERLAAGGANVTIGGRNAVEGAKIVAAMSSVSPNPQTAVHNFLKVDASLMANNKKAVTEFLGSLNDRHDDDAVTAVAEGSEQRGKKVGGGNPHLRLDYLIFCQTKATLQGRTPTKDEGIDEKLALNYYSRVYITNLLAPLMQETAKNFEGADPRMMSVLSAGAHKPYQHWKEDPYLVDHYSSTAAAECTSFYSDLWVDKASRTWPEITFVHVAPGFVSTNWGSDMPAIVRGCIRALQATVAKSATDCAELLLPGLISPELQGGFRLLGEYSHAVPKTKLHTDESVEQVHTDTAALISKC